MSISPDTPETETILKDKFVTQSALNIQRKIQKLAFAWKDSGILQLENKSEALVTALRTMSDETPRGTDTKFHLCGHSGYWKEKCPQKRQRKSKPHKQCPYVYTVTLSLPLGPSIFEGSDNQCP